MYQKNHLIVVVIGAAIMSGIVFSSCDHKTRPNNSITYDSIIVARHVPLVETNDTTLPYSDVNIRFIYPTKFRNAEDLARLQQIFIGTFFDDMKYDSFTPSIAVEEYLAEYTAEYKELSNNYYEDRQRLPSHEMPTWYWYYMSNTNKIMFENDSLLSYAVEYSDYTGGAHGSYRITYVNVDLNELVTVAEEDIFLPNYKKALKEIILKRLMADNDVESPDSLLNIGFFDIDDIGPNNNFWLNNEGVHYTFNQYEIAPYAMGAIDVTVPYKELTEILKPNTIISALTGAE